MDATHTNLLGLATDAMLDLTLEELIPIATQLLGAKHVAVTLAVASLPPKEVPVYGHDDSDDWLRGFGIDKSYLRD